MPRFNVSKSIFIEKDPSHVFQIVSDMGQWAPWSPWLIMDPNAQVTVSGDRQAYAWEGKRTGNGNMHITSKEKDKTVNYDLTFLTPWKSQAKVAMNLTPKQGGTEIEWSMESSLPFFMFFMKKMMTAYIGNDYQRGLLMLKEYAEVGTVSSELNFMEINVYPGCNYVGIIRQTTIDKSIELMPKDFAELGQLARNNSSIDMGKSFCIYHKWDLVKRTAQYTAGVPYTGSLPELKDGWIKGSLPQMKVYTLAHKGPYAYLGNAWSTLYSMVRGNEFKLNKKQHPLETYGNSPMDTPPEDLITYINFPIKS